MEDELKEKLQSDFLATIEWLKSHTKDVMLAKTEMRDQIDMLTYDLGFSIPKEIYNFICATRFTDAYFEFGFMCGRTFSDLPATVQDFLKRLEEINKSSDEEFSSSE